MVGVNCIELPNIQAMVGYVFIASGGSGGIAGMSFALNAPSGGSGTVIVTNTNVPSDMGCDGDYSESERLAVANSGYQQLLDTMEFWAEDDDTGAWDTIMANAWILVNTFTGFTYDFEFPDGTIGEYEVGPNNSLISEESCPQSGGGS